MAELIALPPQIAKLEAGGYIAQPEGTVEITENGIHNVKPYANADVNVQPDLGTLDITENGTYSASTYDKDGFLEVTVDVQPDLIDKIVTENGIYKASEEMPPVDGYRQVEVDIPEPVLERGSATPKTTAETYTPQGDGFSDFTVEATPLEEKTITPTTQEQTVYPQSPNIGFSSVKVGATAPPPILITKQITENGTYTAEDDNADGYDEVEVAVSDPIVNQLLNGTCTEIINHSVTSLREECFYLFTSLQKIYCKEVKRLGFGCFQGAGLIVAFLPKITNIGYNIFYGNRKMQALIIKKQVSLRDDSSFTENPTNVYVPSALISWYSTATNWSVYYGNDRILTIEDNLEFLESFGFTEEELLSAEE